MPTKKKQDGFDDIFTATTETKKSGKKAKATTAKKKSTASKAAPKTAAPAKAAAPQVDPAAFAPVPVLQTAWANHEREALYRKGKEDRLLLFTLAALLALVLGGAAILAAGRALDWHWFGKLVFRLIFAGSAFGVALAGHAMLELNRRRLQDVLAMIVKLQDSLHLFKEGAFPGSDGPFFPNTYKFIGSINDDETNYAQMILKVSTATAIFVLLLLV